MTAENNNEPSSLSDKKLIALNHQFVFSSLFGENKQPRLTPLPDFNKIPMPAPNWALTAQDKITSSCIFKGGTSFIVGYALGGAFSVVMYMMDTTPSTKPEVKFKDAMREGVKEIKSRALSSGKSFAYFGGTLALCSCAIEGYRAKHDLTNTFVGAYITGAVLALPAGLKASLWAGAGSSVLVTAFEHYMES